MKIVVFETESWEAEAFADLARVHDIVFTPDPLTAATVDLHSDAEVAVPFWRSDLSGAVLGRLPKLRLLSVRVAGYEQIDLAHCRARGVAVCHVPSYGDETVAEHAFALLLAVARRIVPAVERTRRGDFRAEGLRGVGLRGSTLGVIGVGRIGRHMIEMAKGFGMNVIASDVRPDANAAAALGFTYASFDEVLAAADVLSLHVPGDDSTRDLIGEREFGLMKPGALLINTARGIVVNHPALVRALRSGRLGGAALDVQPEEALIRNPAAVFEDPPVLSPSQMRRLLATEALLHLPNVVITPHMAFDTDKSVRRMVDATVEFITAFANGAPRNLVPA